MLLVAWDEAAKDALPLRGDCSRAADEKEGG
jgi:hypothetical protein